MMIALTSGLNRTLFLNRVLRKNSYTIDELHIVFCVLIIVYKFFNFKALVSIFLDRFFMPLIEYSSIRDYFRKIKDICLSSYLRMVLMLVPIVPKQSITVRRLCQLLEYLHIKVKLYIKNLRPGSNYWKQHFIYFFLNIH